MVFERRIFLKMWGTHDCNERQSNCIQTTIRIIKHSSLYPIFLAIENIKNFAI